MSWHFKLFLLKEGCLFKCQHQLVKQNTFFTEHLLMAASCCIDLVCLVSFVSMYPFTASFLLELSDVQVSIFNHHFYLESWVSHSNLTSRSNNFFACFSMVFDTNSYFTVNSGLQCAIEKVVTEWWSEWATGGVL